jgi:5-methyltetrahydropteroyltriglutamate--homocysteine methyltransferase
MQIRGQEIAIPVTMVGAYPRPHWLSGRVFGSRYEPLYRSMAARVAFEDAVSLCCKDQERAGLDVLTDGLQYQDWEAGGYQYDALWHLFTEMLDGYTTWGAPNEYHKYANYYVQECHGQIGWVRSAYQGVVDAVKKATDKPFKIGFLGPAQLSILTRDRHYHDQRAIAMDLAAAWNEELRYLRDTFGLEAIQIVDVAVHYLDEPWLVEVTNRVTEGLDDVLKFWHLCYGSVDGQPDVAENKVPEVISVFADCNLDVLSHELADRDYSEIASFKNFPADRVLCAGVVNDHNIKIETPEQVADGIRRILEVIPAERLMTAPDCGLALFPRSVARAKLNALGAGTRIVRDEL